MANDLTHCPDCLGPLKTMRGQQCCPECGWEQQYLKDLKSDSEIAKKLLSVMGTNQVDNHKRAEAILLELLRREGYSETADEFDGLTADWWYD